MGGAETMSKNRVNRNPECGRRLKELITSNGMTRDKFAERLPCSTGHISSIIYGKRSLTIDMAQRIKSEIFPDIRIEWLLCIDDFKTQEEKDAHSKEMWEKSHKAALLYDEAFKCFIDGIEDLCGYGLHSQGTDILIGDYIAVSDSTGEKIGAIPAESFDRLKREIENFASYSLNLLIKTEMQPLPNSTMDGENNC